MVEFDRIATWSVLALALGSVGWCGLCMNVGWYSCGLYRSVGRAWPRQLTFSTVLIPPVPPSPTNLGTRDLTIKDCISIFPQYVILQ